MPKVNRSSDLKPFAPAVCSEGLDTPFKKPGL